MLSKRVIAFYIILAVLTAALQTSPRILGDAFAFAVILSGLPVYIAARFSCAVGISVYLAATVLSAYMNTGEALFFICINGIIGLSLGILKYRFKSTYAIPALSALIAILILFIINYSFGINIFGNSAFRTPIPQALALFPILYVYCLVYLKLAMFANNLVRRNIELNIC